MKPTITNGTYFRTEGLSQEDYEFLIGKMVDADVRNPSGHGSEYPFGWRGHWDLITVQAGEICGRFGDSNDGLKNEIKVQDFKEKQNVKYKKLDLTLREKIERLMAGEVFYSESGLFKILFDENNGFTCVYADTGISSEFSLDIGFYTPATLEDVVSEENPVLCWVNDVDYSEKTVAVMLHRINKNHDYPYTDYRGTNWKYATPVQPKECYGYEE